MTEPSVKTVYVSIDSGSPGKRERRLVIDGDLALLGDFMREVNRGLQVDPTNKKASLDTDDDRA